MGYAVILNDVLARFQMPPKIRIGYGLESDDENHDQDDED